MDPNAWPTLVSQLGFPIFVALYFLLRLDQQLQQINANLQHLIDLEVANPPVRQPG